VVLGVGRRRPRKKSFTAGDTASFCPSSQSGRSSSTKALNNMKAGGFSAFFSHRSTEGSSEFLPYMPLLYGAVCKRVWLKAGAPTCERNLQNYNPSSVRKRKCATRHKERGCWFGGLAKGVKIPAVNG